MNYAAVAAANYASLPFGDGYTATVGGTYGDQDNNHFAQLDRDAETDTDHAQFRQYYNTWGRWMSPDPYNGSYDIANPQSFNRYSYVTNNACRFRQARRVRTAPRAGDRRDLRRYRKRTGLLALVNLFSMAAGKANSFARSRHESRGNRAPFGDASASSINLGRI